jgi:hypothetical protein
MKFMTEPARQRPFRQRNPRSSRNDFFAGRPKIVSRFGIAFLFVHGTGGVGVGGPYLL